MVYAGWGLLLVGLAAASLVGRDRLFSADLFRFGTLLAVAWAVDLSLGVLATLGALPWVAAWYRGTPWEQVAGGTLWPIIAGAVWIGTKAPWWAVMVTLYALVGMGVVQTALVLYQRAYRRPVTGTLGQHTKVGIYLAILSPLSVRVVDSPALALLFGVGVVACRSFTAAAAWGVGMLVVEPRWAPAIVLLALAGLAARSLKFSHGRWKFRSVIKTWRARPGVQEGRLLVWRLTLRDLRGWAWLVGYGPGSFATRMVRTQQWANVQEFFRSAHNDYLEHLYEYGLIGVLAAVWWLWRFGGLEFTDPLSGAIAALGVAMTTSFPLKVAPIACVGLVIAILLMRRSAWA